MRIDRSRRGSALLIVLGMLSFIIVSAIGFSVFMRGTRQPSSYLRRSSATRLVVKAAVARGIDYLDKCIGENPHPGVGGAETSFSGRTYRNTWRNRVLFGCEKAKADEIVAAGSNPTNNVAPLCMEALAYLPPSLVNDVRYFSRLTPTANWKVFELDAGRYNFVAVDVSDFIDINRVAADVRRSSAPNGRISLAYMFEPPSHASGASGADQWDTFMENYREFDPDTLEYKFDGKYPLISLADWNLAMAKQKFGPVSSPFCQFIGTSGGKFYQDSSEADWATYAMMNFVTDSLQPSSAATTENGSSDENGTELALDLNDPANQPFKGSDLDNKGKKPGAPWGHLAGMAMCQSQDWTDCLSYAGAAALFDYLDTDRVPTFTSLPCAERTPVVAGMQVQFPGASVALTGDSAGRKEEPQADSPAPADQPTREKEGWVYYRLDTASLAPAFGGNVRVLSVFPFAHADDEDANETYTIDGRLSLFFSDGRMPLRTGNSNPEEPLGIDWNNLPTSPAAPEKDKAFVMSVPFQEQQIGAFRAGGDSAVVSRETVIQLHQGRSLADFWSSANGEANAFLAVRYKWTQTRQGTGNAGGVSGAGQYAYRPSFDEILANPNHPSILEVVGTMQLVGQDGYKTEKTFDRNQLYGGGIDLYANVGVWLRIKDKEGNAVDVVPATMTDDATARGLPWQQGMGFCQYYGAGGALMCFNGSGGGNPVNIKLTADWQHPQVSNGGISDPGTAFVADPRFNFAPENWFTVAGTLSEELWRQNNGAPSNGEDFYIATSDAGYMQSIYELAMLPAITPLLTGGVPKYGRSAYIGDLEAPVAGDRTSLASSRANALHQHYMYKEYEPWGDHYVTFTNLNAHYWTGGGTGYRISPFATSNVLYAAFANTPLEWRYAHTNEAANAALAGATATDFNKKYAFNQYSQDTKLYWEDMARFAARFSAQARENPDNWEEAVWHDMGWNGDDDARLGGSELKESDPLYRVDRRFLYGYWRDCIQPTQQLFLVFARAEPIMAIAGDINQAPPQQSARAVALVWRDPKPIKGASGNAPPHATRILFYRQFE